MFCKKPLASNEVVETFPVGRRLAFDSAKGRLWVVCGKCRRWSLTPLEERWEAVEDCERLFRATRMRAYLRPMAKVRVGGRAGDEGPVTAASVAKFRLPWILEQAWKEAEEIAAIADSLLLPARTDEFFDRHGEKP